MLGNTPGQYVKSITEEKEINRWWVIISTIIKYTCYEMVYLVHRFDVISMLYRWYLSMYICLYSMQFSDTHRISFLPPKKNLILIEDPGMITVYLLLFKRVQRWREILSHCLPIAISRGFPGSNSDKNLHCVMLSAKVKKIPID